MTTILLAIIIGLLVVLLAWVILLTYLARGVYQHLLDQGGFVQETKTVEETENFLHADFFQPTGPNS